MENPCDNNIVSEEGVRSESSTFSYVIEVGVSTLDDVNIPSKVSIGNDCVFKDQILVAADDLQQKGSDRNVKTAVEQSFMEETIDECINDTAHLNLPEDSEPFLLGISNANVTNIKNAQILVVDNECFENIKPSSPEQVASTATKIANNCSLNKKDANVHEKSADSIYECSNEGAHPYLPEDYEPVLLGIPNASLTNIVADNEYVENIKTTSPEQVASVVTIANDCSLNELVADVQEETTLFMKTLEVNISETEVISDDNETNRAPDRRMSPLPTLVSHPQTLIANDVTLKINGSSEERTALEMDFNLDKVPKVTETLVSSPEPNLNGTVDSSLPIVNELNQDIETPNSASLYNLNNTSLGLLMQYRSDSSDSESSESSTDTESEHDTSLDCVKIEDILQKDTEVLDDDIEESSDQKRRSTHVRVKGELLIEDLPPIEDLRITVAEDECIELGRVHSIVDQLVLVNTLPNSLLLDLNTVLFLEKGKRALGEIFDVLGRVTDPLYCVRFNSNSQIKEKGIEVGQIVYVAPKTEHTQFIILSKLRSGRGSDASWENDIEPPERYLDYSDDEQERRARNSSKNKTDSVNNENTGEDQSKFGKKRVWSERSQNRRPYQSQSSYSNTNYNQQRNPNPFFNNYSANGGYQNFPNPGLQQGSYVFNPYSMRSPPPPSHIPNGQFRTFPPSK